MHESSARAQALFYILVIGTAFVYSAMGYFEARQRHFARIAAEEAAAAIAPVIEETKERYVPPAAVTYPFF